MSDVDCKELETKYSNASHDERLKLYPLIRAERDRRRHKFMLSAPRSKKWWVWHLSLCKSFGLDCNCEKIYAGLV